MTKTCAVLYIYDLLIKEGKFNLKDIENRFACSNRTAARYVAEIKKYFQLFSCKYEIVYELNERSYKLIKLDE